MTERMLCEHITMMCMQKRGYTRVCGDQTTRLGFVREFCGEEDLLRWALVKVIVVDFFAIVTVFLKR